MSAESKILPISTVGRGKRPIVSDVNPVSKQIGEHHLCYGDSLSYYSQWDKPTSIISDGAYGILGFYRDTATYGDLPSWYEAHIKAWTQYASSQTTLWFWNSEIGWATIHPILEKYGWKYVHANIWNKGKGHIAGNVNTKKIKSFPVVTEICAQYVLEPKIDTYSLKDWLYNEWKRTTLPFREANKACGVADAATRKYLTRCHLWYCPPPDVFQKLQEYANTYGTPTGRPYFSIDGINPATAENWASLQPKFRCPYGYTNVWERPALRGKERILVPGGKATHLNQKPLDLMSLLIEASTDEGDAIWEPFGGLFSASIAAMKLNRRAFAAEIEPYYYTTGQERFLQEFNLYSTGN